MLPHGCLGIQVADFTFSSLIRRRLFCMNDSKHLDLAS